MTFAYQTSVGHAANQNNTELLSGICAPASHTAEGRIGDDLTNRQSRFYCDAAVITFFDPVSRHLMVQFAQKASHHSEILGFAGFLDRDGIMMRLEHVYFSAGHPITVSDGACKFFFTRGRMTGIFCGAYVDETGRRTVASVGFNPAPGQ
ncbi:MAG: hypothetical protein JOZ11_06865 [Alphaproteobacteria bacterium]|nr:hypothetical protein [Alphaproteobacteria bacterium]